MISKVKQYTDENKLLMQGDRVLVALSGGADSVALLAVILSLKECYDLEVAAVHINHGLRGDEAERDAQFCVQLAERFGVYLHLYRADVRLFAKERKLGIEAAAREVRYNEFERLCREKGYTKIAVAHHAGDNAETVLMHLLRGSGIDGLRGILPQRGNIIRPLLSVTREEIEAFLQENELTYVTDSTNLETEFLRNRIRHGLLKDIETKYNPNFINTLSEMSQLLTQESLYLNTCADTAFASVCKQTQQGILLDTKAYADLAQAIAFRVMKIAIARTLSKWNDISFDTVKRCHKLCVSGEIGKRVDLSEGYFATMEHDGLLFSKTGDADGYCVKLSIGQTLYLPQVDAYLKAQIVNAAGKDTINCVYFDYDKLPQPLVCRTRLPGDVLQPSGMQGTKKLQDYFTDEKIARSRRDVWPLVCAGNTVLWVCGKRKSGLYAIDAQTKQILKLTYEVNHHENG